MNGGRVHLLALLLLAAFVCLVSCSRETPQQPAQQAGAPSQPQAQQAATPAPAAPSAEAAAVPLKDKYRLYITNRGNATVTASLNGEWVGQWDANVDVPLESVVMGKNELSVELPEAPTKELRVSVYFGKGNESVNLLSLNFEGKSGTHTHVFVVK
jgi:hypothetical protein